MSNKGKIYEEIYGKEKANSLKKIRSIFLLITKFIYISKFKKYNRYNYGNRK